MIIISIQNKMLKKKLLSKIKNILEKIKLIQINAKWFYICVQEHQNIISKMWDYHLLNQIYKILENSRKVEEKNLNIYLWKLSKI